MNVKDMAIRAAPATDSTKPIGFLLIIVKISIKPTLRQSAAVPSGPSQISPSIILSVAPAKPIPDILAARTPNCNARTTSPIITAATAI